MQTQKCIEYFSDPTIADEKKRRAVAIRSIAEALGIRPPSVYGWGETVPPYRQIQLEIATRGKLKAARSAYPASMA